MESLFHAIHNERDEFDQTCLIIAETIAGKEELQSMTVEKYYQSYQSWLRRQEAIKKAMDKNK